MATLRDLYGSHRGRISQKWEGYLEAYESILADRRGDALSLLEIGVQNGGSLEVWARYLERAETLIGCDVDPACGELTFEDGRISVVVGDVGDARTVDRIAQIAPALDIIIDDGSHRSPDIIAAFVRLFPLVRDGGVYIVEDLHCSYLEGFGGGLFAQRSALSFLRRLTDVVNRAHWEGAVDIARLLEPLLPVEPPPAFIDSLAAIRSVEFLDSLCVVRVDRTGRTRLGGRVVAGEVADVDPEPITQAGRPSPHPGQEGLDGLLDPVGHEDAIRALSADVDGLRFELARSLEELGIVTAQRDRILSSRSWRLTSGLRRMFGVLFRRG